MPTSHDRYAIGIDFGTTNSCVAVMMNGKVDIITSDTNSRVTPSVVTFTESGATEVGEPELYNDPKSIVFAIKRLIGRKFNDACVQRDMKMWPFKVVPGPNNEPLIQIEQNGVKLYSPQEVATIIFTSMKETANNYVGHETKETVITVPAYFNEAQRQATRKAAESAGLKILRIINEPTAAAISYWLQRDIQDGNILVYDLGGGTFDVSIVQVNQGCINVKATNGDTHLGGHDFDYLLMDHCVGVIKSQHKVDLENDSEALAKLNRACETAKRRLAGKEQVKIVAEALIHGQDFQLDITRAAFDEMCEPLFKRTIDLVKSSLKDAKMATKDIDQVVLVGGSTRIVKISSLLSELFDGKRPKMNIDADSAVAYGAAVLAEKELRKGDKTHSELNKLKILQLHDVTPLSLGLEVSGERLMKVVKRNTPIPVKETVTFRKSATSQNRLRFAVYQGEHVSIHDNSHLGTIHMRPSTHTEVTFEVNSSGQLSVVVQDMVRGEKHVMDVSRRKLEDPSKSSNMVRFEKIATRKIDPEELRRRTQSLLQTAPSTAEATILSFNIDDDNVDGFVLYDSKAYQLTNPNGTRISARISFIEGGEIFIPDATTKPRSGSTIVTLSPIELCWHQIFIDNAKVTKRAIAVFLNHIQKIARTRAKDRAITHTYCPIPSSWGYINRTLFLKAFELSKCRNITTIPRSVASVLGTFNKAMPDQRYQAVITIGLSASSVAVYEVLNNIPRVRMARDLPVGWLNIHHMLLTAIGNALDTTELNINFHILHEAICKFENEHVDSVDLHSEDGKLDYALTRRFYEYEGVAPIVSEILECLERVPTFQQSDVWLFVDMAGTLKQRFWSSALSGYLQGKTVHLEQIPASGLSKGALQYARATLNVQELHPHIPQILSPHEISYQIFGEEKVKLITKEEEIPVKKNFQHRMRTMFRRMEVFVDGQFLGTLLLERPSHGREITISFSVCKNGLLTVEYAGKTQKFDADYLAHANDRQDAPRIS